MLGGVDPLSERLLETLVAIGDVLGRAAGPRRRDAPAERAEHLVAQRVLGGHRARLLHRDAIERGVAHDLDLAVLEPIARDQLGRCLRRNGGRDKQQKPCDRRADCPRSHRPPKVHVTVTMSGASPSAMWTLQGSTRTGRPVLRPGSLHPTRSAGRRDSRRRARRFAEICRSWLAARQPEGPVDEALARDRSSVLDRGTRDR